jgi:hypothetical protein
LKNKAPNSFTPGGHKRALFEQNAGAAPRQPCDEAGFSWHFRHLNEPVQH